MIIRRPQMVRPSTVVAQPQFALDATRVKALGQGIVRSERRRGNGDRATRRLVLAQGLIPIVQAKMGAELERAETKAECGRFRVERGGDRPVREAQIADS